MMLHDFYKSKLVNVKHIQYSESEHFSYSIQYNIYNAFKASVIK